jgi:hypothetical protein
VPGLESIRHSELEAKPRADVLYRCHICRLELTFDPATDRLTIAPIRDGDDQKQRSVT